MGQAIPNFRLRLARPERVIDAALEVFATKGFAKGRLEDVARLVGVTKPAIYNHFASKDALVAAMVERACLPERPVVAGDPAVLLEHVLSVGAPARVLEFVLNERRTLPGLGWRYRDALVVKLAGWPKVGSMAIAAQLAEVALSKVAFRMLFNGGRDAVRDPREHAA